MLSIRAAVNAQIKIKIKIHAGKSLISFFAADLVARELILHLYLGPRSSPLNSAELAIRVSFQMSDMVEAKSQCSLRASTALEFLASHARDPKTPEGPLK